MLCYIFFPLAEGLGCKLSHFPQCLAACDRNIPFPPLQPKKRLANCECSKDTGATACRWRKHCAAIGCRIKIAPFVPQEEVKKQLSSPFSPFCALFFVMHILMPVVKKNPTKPSHWTGMHQQPSFLLYSCFCCRDWSSDEWAVKGKHSVSWAVCSASWWGAFWGFSSPQNVEFLVVWWEC